MHAYSRRCHARPCLVVTIFTIPIYVYIILGFFDIVRMNTHARSLSHIIIYRILYSGNHEISNRKPRQPELKPSDKSHGVGNKSCRPCTLSILDGQYILVDIFTNYCTWRFLIDELVMFCIWHLFPALPQSSKKHGADFTPASIVADWSARKQQRSERGVGSLYLDGEKPKLSVDLKDVDVSRRTVDGRNPANQLRLVVYPIIYRVLYIQGGCLGFLNHQQHIFHQKTFD